MANPDGPKARNEDANMAITMSSEGIRNDQEYSSDAESQLAAKNAKKKSCFQITSVKASEIPQNDDNDSNDDLDESRAEDFSSSELLDVSKASTLTDLERQEIGENSHSTPKKVTTNNVPPTNSSIVNVNRAVPTNANGNLKRRTGNEPPHEPQPDQGKTTNGNGNPASRFKVVKVPRIEPFTRGRWTCRDYETQPSAQQASSADVNRTEQQQNKDLHSGDSSAASSVHLTGENINAENPLLGGENSTSGTSEKSGNIKSNKGHGLKSQRGGGGITFDSPGNLVDTIKDKLNMDHSTPSEDTDLSEDGDGLGLSLADQAPLRGAMSLNTQPRLQSRRTSAGGAIDNKIEQAMDLVKSHLLYAVREEVEVLKVQIKELADKNEQLQRENAMLRQSGVQQGAPMAMPQQTLPQQQPTALPQGIPQQQTPYTTSGAPQGQTLPPSAQQTLPPPQQGQLPMGIQTLPPQPSGQLPQGMPPQQTQAVTQLPQSIAQTVPAQQPNPEQYAHLQQPPQQSIPMQPSQQQQQHSIPVTQQAGAQQGQPIQGGPKQAVQLNQAQQSSQPPNT